MNRANCLAPTCDGCSSINASVFAELPAHDLERLSGSTHCRRYAKGEMIFHVDEYPPGLFCIHSGKVKIYKAGRDGREQIVRLGRPGDLIGYRSLISGERYSAFAEPLEESDICLIPKDVFFSLFSTNPSLSSRIIALLSHDLKAAEERLVEMAQKPVRERVAETLLLLKEMYGVERDEATLNIRLTRAELATLVGTATESVSRVLSKLQAEKAIAMNGRTIRIADHRMLAEAANLND